MSTKAMEANDVVIVHPAIAMTGRVMFTLIFFLSGITHFTGLKDYVGSSRVDLQACKLEYSIVSPK